MLVGEPAKLWATKRGCPFDDSALIESPADSPIENNQLNLPSSQQSWLITDRARKVYVNHTLLFQQQTRSSQNSSPNLAIKSQSGEVEAGVNAGVVDSTRPQLDLETEPEVSDTVGAMAISVDFLSAHESCSCSKTSASSSSSSTFTSTSCSANPNVSVCAGASSGGTSLKPSGRVGPVSIHTLSYAFHAFLHISPKLFNFLG